MRRFITVFEVAAALILLMEGFMSIMVISNPIAGIALSFTEQAKYDQIMTTLLFSFAGFILLTITAHRVRWKKLTCVDITLNCAVALCSVISTNEFSDVHYFLILNGAFLCTGGLYLIKKWKKEKAEA